MPDTGPAVQNFDLWRGSNLPPVIFGLENEDGTPFPVAGSEFVLTVRWRGGPGLPSKSTDEPASGFVLDVARAELIWTPTLTESQRVPLGPVARFEIERRIDGFHIPLIMGVIIGRGGNNDD